MGPSVFIVGEQDYEQISREELWHFGLLSGELIWKVRRTLFFLGSQNPQGLKKTAACP